MLPAIEQKFRRQFNDPVIPRAIDCGKALCKFPYEQIGVDDYMRLRNLVQTIEKFLGQNGESKKENIPALANHQAV